MLIGECTVEDTLHKDVVNGVDIIPANVDLAAVEIELIDMEKKEFVLRNAIAGIRFILKKNPYTKDVEIPKYLDDISSIVNY